MNNPEEECAYMGILDSKAMLGHEVKQCKNIIVYGARYRGAVLVRFIKANFPEVNVFVAVSGKGQNDLFCAGIYVDKLDSHANISDSALVLIAAQHMFRDEMENTACALGFCNIFQVDDKFYDEMTNRLSLAKELFSRWGANDFTSLTKLQKKNFRYVLSTNDRGLYTVEFLESKGINFSGTNVLDIGCAYGGFSIEAKRRGACNVYGVDIKEDCIALARVNLKDEPIELSEKCKFDVCDITSEKALSMPQKYFDIIFVTDVFEHVYDTCKLLEHIKRLVAPAGSIYFEIPNGLHYFKHVEVEPHYLINGLSLLPPSFWYEKVGYIATYYRRWEYYAALFTHYGFADMKLFNFNTKPDFSKDSLSLKLTDEMKNAMKYLNEKTIDESFSYRDAVNDSLKSLEFELKYDIAEMDVDGLAFKYLSPFWQGILKNE